MLKAHLSLRSPSSFTSPSSSTAMLVKCATMPRVSSFASRVAISGPTFSSTALWTLRLSSRTSCSNTVRSTPPRSSAESTLLRSTMESAQAFRTQYCSSWDNRTYAGSNLSRVSPSPHTAQMLLTLRAAALRTRRSPSSARHTSSGMTNCLQRSSPRMGASSLTNLSARMRFCSDSSSWPICSTMVRTYCPSSAGRMRLAMLASALAALSRTLGVSSESSSRTSGRKVLSRWSYPSSPPLFTAKAARLCAWSSSAWRTTICSSSAMSLRMGKSSSLAASKP
mmetsp:Transcript_534/g.1935  ORF Transcript_534/g.1935 Transcript_534/m.1935 type:complete len:281 (+) Transcript_534:2248-3090(+)